MKMEYVAIVFRMLTFAGIFWESASGSCQVPSDLLNPANLQGEIAYNQSFRHDNCSWNLRRVNESKHVLLIYLKDIQMAYNDNGMSGCSGHLILPETTPFCELPKTRCIVYSTSALSCNFANVNAIATNISTTCSSTLWHFVQTLPRTIRVEANQPDRKTFSLLYKFISCGSSVSRKASNKDAGYTVSQITEEEVVSHGDPTAFSLSALAITLFWLLLYLP